MAEQNDNLNQSSENMSKDTRSNFELWNEGIISDYQLSGCPERDWSVVKRYTNSQNTKKQVEISRIEKIASYTGTSIGAGVGLYLTRKDFTFITPLAMLAGATVGCIMGNGIGYVVNYFMQKSRRKTK